MKKALLIYRINRDDPGNSGVIKKITAQAKAFRKMGIEADKIWLCKDGVLKNAQLIHAQELIPHSLGLYRFYFFQFGKILESIIQQDQYDLIYLRHPFFDPLLVRFLKNTKQSHPKLKVILEINTFPYDAEPKRLLHKVSLWMDKYYRKQAFRFVDVIAHYGMEEKIWGIPCIKLRNGIEPENIPVRRIVKPKEKALQLIAVGNWSYWHGVDRLIKGMGNYYIEKQSKTALFLTIVGDGGVKTQLKNLASKSGVSEYIRFLPATTGKKLNDLFDAADIGIGTLGLHRKGVVYDSSLKHREYCCRGIPFVLSASDPDFPEDLPFVHYAPGDDTDLDLKKLLEVFLNWKESDHRRVMRTYAENNLSWEKQLLRVREWWETTNR